MIKEAFYAPSATADPNRFRLDTTKRVLVGAPDRQFVMGGVLLASAIAALECATERPLVWATAQFLSAGTPGSVIDIDVEPLVVGGKITQARATSREGDRLILNVLASLGGRDDRPERQFDQMPKVPKPETCQSKESHFPNADDMQREFDKRMAFQSDEQGIERLWFRTTTPATTTPALLAIMADFLAGGHTETGGSASLDNTIRVHHIKQTEWVLMDTQFSGLASGAFHGHTRLFAQDGTLLATAGQSGMLPKPGRGYF